MGRGETRPARRREVPCDRPGARQWRFAVGDGDGYVPYFYNPPLDPEARRMIAVGTDGGTEQVWCIDLERDTATQLTAAAGEGQHWAPYIREPVRGIRPQFICWSQPDWAQVLFWEGNRLRRVHVDSLAVEDLTALPADVVPSVPHCSPGGWVAFGYLPAALQERLRAGASVPDLEEDLASGCGFRVWDLARGKEALARETPFWPNHVAASPDHRWVLLCHEGAWEAQRMYLHDVATGELRPLRPQDDGARIGHEFWIDATTVGYHGSIEGRGFFGTIDVVTGERVERPSPPGEVHYGHYHVAPDASAIVTDGEVTPDAISIAPLDGGPLAFAATCRHDWAREGDQRVHPHPHWHAGGRHITFTASERQPDGTVRTCPALLELSLDR